MLHIPIEIVFSCMERGGSVYIVTNKNHTTLYTGVTSDLRARIYQHKTHFYPNSFSARYNCEILVYYKFYPSITEAIAEEKRIKGGNRAAKIKLIEGMNLSGQICMRRYDCFD